MVPASTILKGFHSMGSREILCLKIYIELTGKAWNDGGNAGTCAYAKELENSREPLRGGAKGLPRFIGIAPESRQKAPWTVLCCPSNNKRHVERRGRSFFLLRVYLRKFLHGASCIGEELNASETF